MIFEMQAEFLENVIFFRESRLETASGDPFHQTCGLNDLIEQPKGAGCGDCSESDHRPGDLGFGILPEAFGSGRFSPRWGSFPE